MVNDSAAVRGATADVYGRVLSVICQGEIPVIISCCEAFMFLAQGQRISAVHLWRARGEYVRNKTAKFLINDRSLIVILIKIT